MDKILTFRREKIKKETDQEFFLNPRDIVINGRLLLDLIHTNDVFHYLPFNELMVILFDEFITIVDIKETISNSFKIVKQINYECLFDVHFGKILADKKKGELKKNSSNYLVSFRTPDNDKTIKNFIAFEMKTSNYSLGFFIEYANQEFLLFKYDDIRDESTLKVILKMRRDEFFDILSSNIAKSVKNLKNKNNKINLALLNDQVNNFEFSSVLKYVELNCKNFKTSANTNIVHLIAMKINNIICLGSFEDVIDMKFKFEYFHSVEDEGEGKIIDFTAKTYKDYLILIKITSEYEVSVDFFKCVFNLSNNNPIEFIKTQKISFNNNNSVINCFDINFNFEYIGEEKCSLIICKLDTVFLSNLDSKKLCFNLTHIFVFSQMTNSLILQSFIIQDFIFVFDSKGNFSYEKINQKSNTNPPYNYVNRVETLKTVRDVFSVKKFHTDLGFFILGSNIVFKGNEFNICYFLPNILREKEIFDILTESNLKIFNNISTRVGDKALKLFFSFCLSEFLVVFYSDKKRNKDKERDNSDYRTKLSFFDRDKINSISDNLQANEFLFHLINRIKIYTNKLKGFNDIVVNDIKDENDYNLQDQVDSKSYLIHQFRSLMSDSIDDFNEEYGWGGYINSEDFKCEICPNNNNNYLCKYLDDTRSYACSKGHLTFGCCVSFLPLLEDSNQSLFYMCEECNLIYSENSLIKEQDNKMKIRICLVCQKILKLL